MQSGYSTTYFPSNRGMKHKNVLVACAAFVRRSIFERQQKAQSWAYGLSIKWK
jgi:hypothetical protein